jgi:peroxiredoxin
MFATAIAAILMASPAAGAPKVEGGKEAPDFSLADQAGKTVKLSGFRGKKAVLLAFYPKDFTPDSAAELTRFREEHDACAKAGIQVLGISPDTVDSHKKFRDSLKLPFPLLADEGGKAAAAYGSPGNAVADRSVFLVDRGGKVIFADRKFALKPASWEALLGAVRKLGGGGGKMKFEGLEFGRITIDGKTYSKDVVIADGQVRERKKGPSKADRKTGNAHTPLTAKEEIPWDCKVLIIGTGMQGALPVTDDLTAEAKRRGVRLIPLKTPEAVKKYEELAPQGGVNAVLHITC